MIVYIGSHEKEKGDLLCTSKEDGFDINCFDFFVQNGGWSGTFCDGQMEIHHGGRIVDNLYATIDESQFPEWTEISVKEIKEREKRRALRDENPLELYDDTPF